MISAETTTHSHNHGSHSNYCSAYLQECIDPTALEVKCHVCTKLVKTCSAGGNMPCPVHPNGIELGKDCWVCSEECHDVAMGISVDTPFYFNMDSSNYIH